MISGSGLLKYQSPADVQAQEEQKERELEAERNPEVENMLSSLAQHVDKQWKNAREVKKPIEEAMMKSTRQRKGEYEPTKLSQIREANQPEIFMNITDTKCRNAIAWIKDILLQQGERIFVVDPTELPDLPPEITAKVQQGVVQDYIQNAVMEIQQTGQMVDVNAMRNMMIQKSDEIKDTVKKEINRVATKLAEELGDKIHDDWQEGGFYKALEGVIDDIINLKAGVMKGIVFRKERVFKNVLNQQGIMTKQKEEKIVPQWERRSPWFIFPSPRATEVDNGYLIDIIPLRPKQLYNLIGVDGYDAKAIRNVLREFREGGLKNDWLGLSDEFKLGTSYTPPDESTGYPEEFIYVIELWDDIPGEMLREWGLKEIEDDDEEYSAVVWKIGDHVIRAMLNYDVRGRKPFSKTSFQNVNDSFWGEDVPEKIADCQQVCNACARSILANIGMGALPQVELNIDRLPPGASKTIWSGKVWETTEDMMASGSKAVNFFQPVMVTEKLMNTYGVFSKIADEHSGVPAYAHGSEQVGGAGNALADYEKILTPTGTKEISRIKRGDIICNTYGGVSTVTGVYPQDGERDIYKIYFSDSSTVDCDLNHIWSVIDHHGKERTETTASLIKSGLRRTTKSGKYINKVLYKWCLPKILPVKFEDNTLKIDPYTMGLLIGDGCIHEKMVSLTVNDNEVEDILKRIPYATSMAAKGINSGNSTAIRIKGIRKEYGYYGLDKVKASEKFIPEDYLYSSLEDRVELLRGLMDSDGSVDKRGNCIFTTTSEKLLDNLKFLVKSLGGRIKKGCKVNGSIRTFPNLRKYLCKDAYYINFVVPYETISYLDKKQNRYIMKPIRNIYIKDIKNIGKSFATCISVDSVNSLYMCANFIPTHNTSSGLQQLIQMASRGIKSVVRNIDMDIIVPSLERHYDYLLDNQQVFGLVGDYNLAAKGTSAVLAREQLASRKIEFMANTANPIDVGIIGQANRRKMLFEVAKTLGLELGEQELPPPMQQLPQGAPPPENPQALDAAGAPAQGVDNRQFNQQAPVQMMKDGGRLKKGEVAIVGEEAPEIVANVNGETVVTPINPAILGAGYARKTAEEIIEINKRNREAMEKLFGGSK